jgi:hypothetical protein
MALNGYRSVADKASRLVETRLAGLVVVTRIAAQDYEIHKDGVRLGRVTKRGRGWYAERDVNIWTSRADAIDNALVGFYQRHRSAA